VANYELLQAMGSAATDDEAEAMEAVLTERGLDWRSMPDEEFFALIPAAIGRSRKRFKTMADVRAANRLIGNHWFERSTMRFFKCRIESTLVRGQYFITSEERPDGPRRYSVRCAKPDGTIDTVGEFFAYLTKEDARDAIRALLDKETT
jgi:hypothetical protein